MVESMLKSPLIEQFSEEESNLKQKEKKTSQKKPPTPVGPAAPFHAGMTQGSGFNNNPMSYPGSQGNTKYSKFCED